MNGISFICLENRQAEKQPLPQKSSADLQVDIITVVFADILKRLFINPFLVEVVADDYRPRQPKTSVFFQKFRLF